MANDTPSPSASADNPSTEISTSTTESSGQTVDNVDVSLRLNYSVIYNNWLKIPNFVQP